MLKKILLGILTLIVLVLAGLYLFVSSDVTVEHSIIVNAPAQYAFDQANTLKNWENWSPFDDEDPTMKTEYGEPSSGQGAYYTWTGDNGSGKLTIIESNPTSSLKTAIDFGGQGEGDGSWTFTPEGDKTKVTWGFHANVGMSPMGKFFALMMPRAMEKYMTKGLASLKAAAEAEAAKPVPVTEPEPETDETDGPAVKEMDKKGQ